MKQKSSDATPRKVVATTFLNLVVEGRIQEAYARHVRQDMRHHNVAFAGDAESLQKAMEEDQHRHPRKTLEIKHVLEDGDFVAVHSHLMLHAKEPDFAVVHLFRFEGDQIVEMWDLAQVVPQQSPNRNGMF